MHKSPSGLGRFSLNFQVGVAKYVPLTLTDIGVGRGR
jgi:hypothetical protein